MNNEELIDNLFIVNLSSYTTPKIEENKKGSFIEYGKDNDYFQYLIDRYVGSTTNQSIITSICRLIYGKGLDALDSKRKIEDYAKMKVLLKPKDVRRVIKDRKKLGLAAMQITYKGKKVHTCTHFPMETLRAGVCNKNGEIDHWYYHPNWAEYRPSDKLTKIPVFGSTNGKSTEIYIISPYEAGYKYYPPVDYAGSLPYAVLEEEIADYLINDTINGFSGTKVVNLNNGIPDKEKQQKIKKDILRKLTGTKGEKVIVAFNNNSESKTTVDDLPLNDAPEHYSYLSDEAEQKILKGHRAPSWLMGANNGGQGLSSNADEVKNQMLVFDNFEIKPYQEELIDAFEEILAVNDISLKLYFKTIQPLEFIEADNLVGETKEEETGIKQDLSFSKDGEGFDDDEMLEALDGESINLDEWELVDTREWSEDNESCESWAKRLIKEKLSLVQKLSRYIKSHPNKESALDATYYKIRYKYSERHSSENSRKFCKNMMSRSGKGVVYRKEDIDQASFQGVNKEFGHKGQNYSLFRFKGGVNCGHYWEEQLYRHKTKSEKYISKGEIVDDIPKSRKPKGKQYEEAKIAPKDMPNNGHHPNYGK